MVSKAMFIDGIRTPFQLPHTGYANMTGAALLSAAIRRLLSRVKIDKLEINHMVVGNVFHEIKSPNIGAVSAVASGINVPSHSLSMACISGQAALAKGIEMINSDYAEVVLVGGVEYLSDLPVLVNEKVRKTFIKCKNPDLTRRQKLALLSKIRPRDAAPDFLKVVEFQTKETFVHNGDKIAARFGISRWDQDEYGYRSHRLSKKAAVEEKFPFICAVQHSKTNETVSTDGTLRRWTREKMSKRRPVLRGGSVTIATANQPCDGAAVCLLASERAAQRLNMSPRAELSPVLFAACSPKTDLLMGTTHSLARLKLEKGVDLEKADVLEFYEGFGGEVLSQLSALSSTKYAQDVFSQDTCIADLDIDKLNLWGGTIGLGHPFGATGIRLLLHTVGRLEEEDGELGVVAGCAGGGQGAAFTVTRIRLGG
ncbi:trifunctional enzyme subunit beta, mitochondrial-like [Bolinopsis microptera]|uniref:trifunctional enzyme subunit beta, mitochondrial-like n=1 Tax=Bolinopsis microptera TaxID=2820187 RepID=UPI00307A9968